ncbi:hypothetical protein M3649_17945 [Ureibacillus chungkukjangi]|uniref:hypothetical protein n=1 Tax=Ureibacillus chungkukjangi TaxID=1202712 RepID=UPI000D37649F|nr:hypothetical protein [Ureibacillus chungkukjangi]MCM3390004.1 hypothetical protein [Ureibacillus chungkukjangi]
MVNTTTFQEVNRSKFISDCSLSGLTFGTRKAYLREETGSERIWREDRIFKYTPRHCFRLTMTFEDHSEKHFSIFSENRETAIANAPIAVQDLVDSLNLSRVVWHIEGGTYHIASAKVKLAMPNKSKLRQWKEKVNQALEEFFFVNDLD